MYDAAYWLAIGKIIWIDILLSGDNALVIAMACRGLPPSKRMWGMILGAGAAITMRIVFTGTISQIMNLPYLKIIGGLALLVVAAKLLVPEDESETEVNTTEKLWQAVRIVAVADVVMSLDNVIAIAAASGGDVYLLIFGLVVSIPLIISGAAIIVNLLTKFPILVWAGAALLGWIAGEVIVTDPYMVTFFPEHVWQVVFGAWGVMMVMISGLFWRSMKTKEA